MADVFLTDKTAYTTPQDNDAFHIVDVADLTGSPGGTSKKILYSTLKDKIVDPFYLFGGFVNSIQVPATLGVEQIVTLGFGTTGGDFSFDGQTITFLQNSTYAVSIRLRVSRSVATGIEEIAFKPYFNGAPQSINGGPFAPITCQLENTNQAKTILISIPYIKYSINDTLSLYMCATQSAGPIDIGLYPDLTAPVPSSWGNSGNIASASWDIWKMP